MTLFLRFFVLISFLFTLLPFGYGYMAEEAGEETDEINFEESIEFAPSLSPGDVINFNVFEDIAKARELLEGKTCGFQVVQVKTGTKIKKVKGKSKGKGKTGKGKKSRKAQAAQRTRWTKRAELGEFAILLAIENVKTREIRVVRVHPKLGGRSGDVMIEPGKSNGVNTRFTIVHPEHHIVLALRRPVRHQSGFKEVVYTPYSADLDIPVVRKAGFDYLRNTLVSARNDLMRRGVRPRSGEPFVGEDLAICLAIIEHIDPGKFESGKYTPEQLINETLVIMGTNRDHAYRYSASRAGARGLFQFIPNTYKRMVQLYPQAGLNKDFIQGMEDHENAAKASFLLFDADLRTLNNGKSGQIPGGLDTTGRFLASSYNCGSGKTRTALDRYGASWPSGVPLETRIYLKKFDAVWEWLCLRTDLAR